MSGPPSWDWVYWLAGAVLGAAGLALLAWALFADRSRGCRRCPKCWYDMSAVPGLKCPECGTTAKHERRFFKTRRRKGWAAAGMAVILLGGAAAMTPSIQRNGGWAYAPTTVIILLYPLPPVHESQGAYSALGLRVHQGHVWHWQKRLLASRCAPLISASHTQVVRLNALKLLSGLGRDGSSAVPALIAIRADPDFIIAVGSMGDLAIIGFDDARAIPVLKALLTDPATNPTVRNRVANRLGDAGAAAAPFVPELIEFLRNPELSAESNGFNMGAVANTLARIGPPASAAVPTLDNIANNPARPAPLRYDCTMAAAVIRADVPGVLAFHLRSFNHADAPFRESAARYMLVFDMAPHAAEAIPGLLRLVDDPDSTVRAAAQQALGAFYFEIPAARALLDDLERKGDERARAVVPKMRVFYGSVTPAAGPVTPAPPSPPPPPPPR